MQNIKKLITEIIPYPDDYSHRNGFNNEIIIDTLNDSEKIEVENELINLLLEKPNDLLIAESLAYMKSKKSLDNMYKLLSLSKRAENKLILASCIFRISNDPEMIEIAFETGKKITDKYSLTSMFYYLAKFKNDRINDLIRQYESNADYLLSYNAKRALKIENQ